MIGNLASKLKSIVDSVDKVQTSYLFEREGAEGTPFATITPSANENAYRTTTENERVYAFDIRLFVERKGQSTPDSSESAMRGLVDDVLDALDRNWDLPNLTARTGYTYLYMEAAPSVWGYSGAENEFRVAEIRVRCHFSVDVNLI